MLGVENMNK